MLPWGKVTWKLQESKWMLPWKMPAAPVLMQLEKRVLISLPLNYCRSLQTSLFAALWFAHLLHSELLEKPRLPGTPICNPGSLLIDATTAMRPQVGLNDTCSMQKVLKQ